MAILRNNDIKKMSEKEIENKVKDLKFELVRNKINANKNAKVQTKEIKRTIARLLTLQKLKILEKTK